MNFPMSKQTNSRKKHNCTQEELGEPQVEPEGTPQPQGTCGEEFQNEMQLDKIHVATRNERAVPDKSTIQPASSLIN